MHAQHFSKSSPSSTDYVNDSLSDLVTIKVHRLEDFKNLVIGTLTLTRSEINLK